MVTSSLWHQNHHAIPRPISKPRIRSSNLRPHVFLRNHLEMAHWNSWCSSKMVMFHSYVAVYQRVARRNVSKLQYASLLFGFFFGKTKNYCTTSDFWKTPGNWLKHHSPCQNRNKWLWLWKITMFIAKSYNSQGHFPWQTVESPECRQPIEIYLYPVALQ